MQDKINNTPKKVCLIGYAAFFFMVQNGIDLLYLVVLNYFDPSASHGANMAFAMPSMLLALQMMLRLFYKRHGEYLSKSQFRCIVWYVIGIIFMITCLGITLIAVMFTQLWLLSFIVTLGLCTAISASLVYALSMIIFRMVLVKADKKKCAKQAAKQ